MPTLSELCIDLLFCLGCRWECVCGGGWGGCVIMSALNV